MSFMVISQLSHFVFYNANLILMEEDAIALMSYCIAISLLQTLHIHTYSPARCPPLLYSPHKHNYKLNMITIGIMYAQVYIMAVPQCSERKELLVYIYTSPYKHKYLL